MPLITLPAWWKAHEIPLGEYDLKNIQLYCPQEGLPWDWSDAFYIFRLSPPFSIYYGGGGKSGNGSPLIYAGTGRIERKWGQSRFSLT